MSHKSSLALLADSAASESTSTGALFPASLMPCDPDTDTVVHMEGARRGRKQGRRVVGRDGGEQREGRREDGKREGQMSVN